MTDNLAKAQEMLDALPANGLKYEVRVEVVNAYIRLAIAERLIECMTDAAIQRAIGELLANP